MTISEYSHSVLSLCASLAVASVLATLSTLSGMFALCVQLQQTIKKKKAEL